MRFALKTEGTLHTCLLALFICRAVLASAIVPPWQGPDEPTHFALTRLLEERHLDTAELVTLPDGHGNVTTIERDLQRGVLMSMARHQWWDAYGGRPPEPLPTAFAQVPRLGIGLYAQPLYYGIGAATLRVTQPTSLEAAYVHLRLLSIALSVAALSFGWAGTRLLFGAAIATGATAIAALHPQFLLTSIAVNPDALLIVLGAFMWWQVARVITGRRSAFSVALIVIAAGAALLTKRSAVPLASVAGIIAMGSFLTPAVHRITGRSVAWMALLLVVGVTSVAGAWMTFEGQFTQLATFWKAALNIRRPFDEALLPGAIEYARISIDYAWLVAGWLRFPAPEPWLWVVRVLTVAGFAGAAVLLIRSRELRRPLSIAWLFVFVQAATVIGWGFLTLSSPQGRYLFPVIAPATALLWLGLTHVVPVRLRPYAAPVLVAILAIMDVTAFTTVLIPAYLPWG